jgi:UPF0755 protein
LTDQPTPELGTRSRRQIADNGGGEIRGGGYRPRANGSPESTRLGWLTRLMIIASIIGLLIIGAYAVLLPVFGDAFRSAAEGNPDLMRLPFVADAVRDRLGDRLDQPAGTDATPVDFVIASGTSSGQITDDLVDRELVTDRLAFSYLLITEGAGSRLRAGTHVLDRTMSPRQVADELQQIPEQTAGLVTVALKDGLRIEQMTAQFEDHKADYSFDPADFYQLAEHPTPSLLADYPALAIIPEGNSLEGFFGAGVFEVDHDISAEEMVRVLLDRWMQSGAPEVLDRAKSAGKDAYDVVVLASLVQRETTVETEAPLIAGVYQNRIDGLNEGIRLLNADPTVIYAKDTLRLRDLPVTDWPQYAFWNYEGIGDMSGFRVPPDLAGFQTWHSRGLPSWPLCSPTLSSLEAALAPDTADGYVYFVAKGDGSNEHAFASTYEEHLQNIERYLRATPAP